MADLSQTARDPSQYFTGPATANPMLMRQGVAMRRAWDTTSAARAKELEKAGTKPQIIWQETGTWKGPDGKWRQEISNAPVFETNYQDAMRPAFGNPNLSAQGQRYAKPSDGFLRDPQSYKDMIGNFLEMISPPVPTPEEAKAGLGSMRADSQLKGSVMQGYPDAQGLLADQAYDKMGNIAMAGMNVYHGTPHRFPPTKNNPLGEFDAAKIGTGEGAQAYGHGLYLAENPQTARIYSADRAYVGSAMQGKPSTINFDDPAWLAQKTIDEFGDTSKATSHLKMVQRTAAKQQSPETKAQVQAAIDLLESGNIATKGNLYKVDLPDEQIAKMLDWDKPLSQQRQLKQAIDKFTQEYGLVKPTPNMTGKEYYQALENYTGATSAEGVKRNVSQDVSGLLKQYGIPGIRYLDQGSRTGGAGTSNFVVFDPKHMNIIGRE